LVVSLDFELMWGVRDQVTIQDGYAANILGAREAVPRMLDLFAEFGVAATWATVGALFASSREEFQEYLPSALPTYDNRNLSPFADVDRMGKGTESFYFAPALVEEIASRPRQELASHTFSHYYCLEPSQNATEFRADMESAVAIAAARGHKVTSLVFPRNQVNESYLPILVSLGFTAFRGASAGPFSSPHAASSETMLLRGIRLADSLVSLSGPGAVPWSSVDSSNGLANVRASRFLRPYTRLRVVNEQAVRRVCRGIENAAQQASLYHLWWHPHNLGQSLAENLENLRKVLEVFAAERDSRGFESYTMQQVASIVMTAANDPSPRASGIDVTQGS